MAKVGKNSGAIDKYSPEFLELERRKRYGFVNKFEEDDEAYRITMYFPTIVPPCDLRTKLGIPEEMPDYEYDVSLDADTLTVRARLRDENVLKLTGLVNSFPDRFFKDFILAKPVNRFEASYRDKVLHITAYKVQAEGNE